MKILADLIYRQAKDIDNGLEIPWADPEFSRRILKEHLNQDNDIASRRIKAIDKQVQFIHHQLLMAKKTTILDLGCGPGLYSHRLANLGHRCTGIDISPASIQYAKEIAEKESLKCTFIQDDFLKPDLGSDFGFAMLTFGDFNALYRPDGERLVEKIFHALEPGGVFLLEGLTLDGAMEIGERQPAWLTAESGIFSDNPYLYLEECSWNEQDQLAIANYYIIESVSGHLTYYRQRYYAYSDNEYQDLLSGAGFESIEFYPGFGAGSSDFADDLVMIVARKSPDAF